MCPACLRLDSLRRSISPDEPLRPDSGHDDTSAAIRQTRPKCRQSRARFSVGTGQSDKRAQISPSYLPLVAILSPAGPSGSMSNIKLIFPH